MICAGVEQPGVFDGDGGVADGHFALLQEYLDFAVSRCGFESNTALLNALETKTPPQAHLP